eukprot:5797834-Pleurochrysis_carterae.AAC.1
MARRQMAGKVTHTHTHSGQDVWKVYDIQRKTTTKASVKVEKAVPTESLVKGQCEDRAFAPKRGSFFAHSIRDGGHARGTDPARPGARFERRKPSTEHELARAVHAREAQQARTHGSGGAGWRGI